MSYSRHKYSGFFKRLLKNKIPAHLSGNFLPIPNFDDRILDIIEMNDPMNPLESKEFFYRKYIDTGNDRLEFFRNKLIPWVDSIKPLKGLRLLEIGCGTGSSSIAFAEQGAQVTSIDINEKSLAEARVRCQLYGLNISFYLLNAADIKDKFEPGSFDLIIFMASIEHMTIEERIQSLKMAYEILPQKGLLCIAGSPNRLHFMDSHTSRLPFFHWLPDCLAVPYSQFSDRNEYSQHLKEVTSENEKMEQLYRWGRGFSFHEIEIALKPLAELKIASNLLSFLRNKNLLYAIGTRFTANYKYEKFLHKRFPAINEAFLQPYIDLVIEKD